MPTGIEAALVLIVLAGPGFIASRFLNSLVPYRPPTVFQETTQAIVFSAVLVPVWLLCSAPLLASRNVIVAAWYDQHAAAPLPGWAIVMPLAVFASIYFIAAPVLALVWAVFIRAKPHVRLAQYVLSTLGIPIRYDEGPEVWDEIFGRDDTQRWIRVCYRDGHAIEGVLVRAGVSPSARQVHLSALPDVANSLTVLGDDGAVKRDLSQEGVTSVWIDITTEVHRIEVYAPDEDDASPGASSG
jgi:Family of unknown function (DUF6338)